MYGCFSKKTQFFESWTLVKFSLGSCCLSEERLNISQVVSIISPLCRIPCEHPTLLVLGEGEGQGAKGLGWEGGSQGRGVWMVFPLP